MDLKKLDMKKCMYIVLLILFAVFSITVIAPWASDPETHTHSIEQTEDKISTVMTLSGGSAATSATLSLLPGDLCTPIAEQLAEMATYFILILSALYLEKFMITLSGYLTFWILIPMACVFFISAIISGKEHFKTIGYKIAVTGLIIFLIVPSSVILSDIVYQTQAESVERVAEESKDMQIESESSGGFLNEITTITSNTIDKLSAFVEDMLEALAVMLVTACIIPILVFVFLVWLVKTIFSSNIPVGGYQCDYWNDRKYKK